MDSWKIPKNGFRLEILVP